MNITVDDKEEQIKLLAICLAEEIEYDYCCDLYDEGEDEDYWVSDRVVDFEKTAEKLYNNGVRILNHKKEKE